MQSKTYILIKVEYSSPFLGQNEYPAIDISSMILVLSNEIHLLRGSERPWQFTETILTVLHIVNVWYCSKETAFHRQQ